MSGVGKWGWVVIWTRFDVREGNRRCGCGLLELRGD